MPLALFNRDRPIPLSTTPRSKLPHPFPYPIRGLFVIFEKRGAGTSGQDGTGAKAPPYWNKPTPYSMAKKPLDRWRVALVEDHVLVRQALAAELAAWPRGQLVVQACDGVDLEEQLATTAPVQLAVVDLMMPRRDGFATLSWLRTHHPATKLLAITHDPTDDAVYAALQAGAHGVLGKAVEPATLLAALDSLYHTGLYANDLLMRQVQHTPDPNSPMALRKKLEKALCPREREFLKAYISDESPSRQTIAKRMKISIHTAEKYRKNIVSKTEARTRVALLRLALRFNFVRL